MSLNRLLRPTLVAALATGGIGSFGSMASANVEVGGMAGVHVFSDTNELGVNDVAGAPSERNSALFGARVGVFFGPMIGIEGEFGVVPSEARQLVYDVWNITYRAQIVAQFRTTDDTAKLIPFVFVGGGGTQIVKSDGENVGVNSIVKDTDAALYVGLGAKYRVDNGWGLRVDGRILFPPASNEDADDPMAKASDGFTTDFELLLSIYKEFGRKAPEKKEVPVPIDDDPDKDGIHGDNDKCPNEPEDKDGFEDENGCPDNDNDNDGIADAADQCKMEPEDVDGFEDENGCPDPDNDKDGVLDGSDQCKNEPEDKDGFEDDNGCPDPDNDQDGVLDAADKCPDKQETRNGFEDTNGCPDEIPEKLKKFTGTIAGINFKVNEATLLPTSYVTLDKAVAVLKEFGDLKMEIQGHTDDQVLKANKGSKFQNNQELSQGRAESVTAYMVSKGIDASRLTAKGYGDSVPSENPAGLTGGKLAAARTKNRRVEFKLISPLDAVPPAPKP